MGRREIAVRRFKNTEGERNVRRGNEGEGRGKARVLGRQRRITRKDKKRRKRNAWSEEAK